VISEDKLKIIIDEALESRSRIDIDMHAQHHDFIQHYIEEQERKRERWEAIQRQVFGWGIIALVGTIGSLIAQKFGIDL